MEWLNIVCYCPYFQSITVRYADETIVIEDNKIYNDGQEISLTEVSAQIVPGKF